MTLARKRDDGSVDIGGVWCHFCQTDRYVNSRTHRCTWCKSRSPYRPRGLVVRNYANSSRRRNDNDWMCTSRRPKLGTA